MDPVTYKLDLESCQIRPNKDEERKKRVKTAWHYSIGVFKEYLKEEKSSLLEKCFKFDMENMKQIKFKKSDEKEVRAEMFRVYAILKEQYRLHAGYNP